MNIKKELIIGIIGSVIIILITIFYGSQYKLNTQKLSGNRAVSQTTSTVTLTTSEVAKHNISSDCWIIVDNSVYQVTEYLTLHPGGSSIITPYCGADATTIYNSQGGRGSSHSSGANQELSSLKLGNINEMANIQNNNIQQSIDNIKKFPNGEREDDD